MMFIVIIELIGKRGLKKNLDVEIEIMGYLESLGPVKDCHGLGSKYWIAAIEISQKNSSKLSRYMRFGSERIYEFRFFIHFKQFKKFIVGMERRFVYFTSSEDPQVSIQKVHPAIQQRFGDYYHEVFTQNSSSPDISSSEIDRNTSSTPSAMVYMHIIEIAQKKKSITVNQINEINDLLNDEKYIQRYKLFPEFVNNLFKSSPYKNPTEYFFKPTLSIYYLVYTIEQPRDQHVSNYKFKVNNEEKVIPVPSQKN